MTEPFEPSKYAPAVAELLREPRVAPLGPGRPNEGARPRLAALDDYAFAPHRVRDRDMAAACRAGLWLYHDFLDESHRISQELGIAEGSYWHALMHRREPDYDNSKYWFRRVGNHPIFASLRPLAAELAAGCADPAARFLTTQAAWAPFAFVDLCERAAGERHPCHELCRQVQMGEWALLFDYCYEHAVERKSR
jgi:hypothetical protein